MLDVLGRLKAASGANSDLELSRMLGLSKQAVAGARSTKNVPSSWIPKASLLFNVSTDWLFFGRGPMRQGETAPTALHNAPAPPPVPDAPLAAQENTSAVCAELKRELDLERFERHELTAQVRHVMTEMCQTTTENRQLTAEIRALMSENRQLWKENGELREKCARLETHQYQCTSCDGGEAVESA